MDKNFVQAMWRVHKLLDKTLLRKDVLSLAEFAKLWNENRDYVPEGHRDPGRDIMITYYNHYLFDNYIRKNWPELVSSIAANNQKSLQPVDLCVNT